MKNKKGFTLIELLVTIALMLSILGIAIVSFINVSNKKKEEAWEKVKNQTELAAEEYFNDNAYYKELLSSGSIKVSLGRLVEENYLNVVTNPKTGKTLNKCSYVNVEKDANGEKYTFVEDNESKVCNFDNYFGYEVPGGPKINLEITGTPGKNDWYKSSVSITAKGLTNNNGKIIQAGICKDVNKCSEFAQSVNEDKYVDNTTYKNDTNYVETSYMVVNSSTKMAFKTVKIKVDKTVPTCKSSVNKNPSNTGWYNKNNKPTLTFSATDNLSGIDGDKTNKPDIEEGNQEYTHTFYDNAGNSTDCSYTIKYDGTVPTCSLSLDGTKGNIVEKLQWYKSDVIVNASFSDGLSGISSKGLATTKNSTNGKTSGTQTSETSSVTWYGHITDKAGNSGSCSKTFALEKNVTLSFDINTTNDAIATASGAKKGKVFNTGYSGILRYSDTDYSGNCLRKKSDSYVGCAVDSEENKFYFGISCMDIGNFIRTFNVSSKSFNGSVIYGGGESTSSGLEHIESGDNKSYTRKQKPDSDFGKSYKAANLNNNGSKVNFTKHTFQYTSPAGNKSNFVTLYTQYTVDCGY